MTPPSPPLGLVVSPGGRHAAMVTDMGSWSLDEGGVAVGLGSNDVKATDDVVFVRGEPRRWDAPSPTGPYVTPFWPIVRRVDDKRSVAVWVGGELRIKCDPNRPLLVELAGGTPTAPETHWIKVVAGTGVAAIDEDFKIFLALASGQLQVFAIHRDPRRQPTRVAAVDVGLAARWISLVRSNVVLLAPQGTGTRLRVLSKTGALRYSVTLPFEVLQPAIAGTGTRTYLAGKGLLALDNGKVTWHRESVEPIHASAFEDGSLAVVSGKRLELWSGDGTVEQSFDTEEPLTTPPAIAGDGSVWAASANALYIAR